LAALDNNSSTKLVILYKSQKKKKKKKRVVEMGWDGIMEDLMMLKIFQDVRYIIPCGY